MRYMYWAILFIFCAILFMVYFVHSVRAENHSHNWNSEKEKVDDNLKRKIQEQACCPTTFYDSCDPAIIEKAYQEARIRGEREGFFPVILVLEENLVIDFGFGYDNKEFDLAKAQVRRNELIQTTENGKDWLDLQFRCLLKDFEAESPDFYKDEVLGEHVTNGIGNTSFNGIINDETGKTLPLLLAEVPVQQPWQIFAWFPYGGWNACPEPEHFVSVAKHWYERYGAVPAVIAQGVVEFIVPQPVSENESLPLAKEHYAFCTDIVDQNVGTINALADILRKSTVWFFWWD